MRGDVLSLFVGETLDKILKTNLVPYMATPALLERHAGPWLRSHQHRCTQAPNIFGLHFHN